MDDHEPQSILELPFDEAEDARLDAEADAEIQAGKGVPHERVREWLLKLAKGEKVPPPQAVASSSTCPVFVARDLSAPFVFCTGTCWAEPPRMGACHAA